MGTTYYTKRGRRYVPVAECDMREARPHGSYLCTVSAGMVSYRPVEPAMAAIVAAAERAREPMQTALTEAMQSRPAMALTTPRQRETWEAFAAAMGETPVLVRSSIYDIVDAGLAALARAEGKPT